MDISSNYLNSGDKTQNESKLPAMVSIAIENAASHGIKLHAGVLNLADGNCAFEACIDSLSMRTCFQEIYDGTPDYYRKIWMTEVEEKAYDRWHGGLSTSQWKERWTIFKESRIYENDLGDLVLPGIAHCTKKDILIFNTSPQAFCPVYVVESSKLCDQFASTEIPICLAYNQVHYEMLIPDTDEDTQKTIILKKEVISVNSNKILEN